MARSMLSFGTEFFLAFCTASYRVGFPAGSPPPVRAATSTFLISLANSFPRRASTAAFLCLVVAHLEWPLMSVPSPCQRSSGGCAGRQSTRDGRRWQADDPAGDPFGAEDSHLFADRFHPGRPDEYGAKRRIRGARDARQADVALEGV